MGGGVGVWVVVGGEGSKNGGIQKRECKERTAEENDGKLGLHHAFENVTSEQF